MNDNSGHGHVWERPDGVKARCGGPGICTKCSQDLAAVIKGQGFVAKPEPKTNDLRFIEKVLQFFASGPNLFFKGGEGPGAEEQEELYWTSDAGKLSCHLMCSDTFAYACADCEEITPENFYLLENAAVLIQSLPAAKKGDDICVDHFLLGTLFVALVRGVQPLPQIMKDIKYDVIREAFETCDPNPITLVKP